MKANKNDVWSEFVSLLSSCPTQYNKHVAVASLLTHLFDDDELDNACLMEAIRIAKQSLAGSVRKPCRSVGMSGRIEEM
jgi:hypothetical protein